MIKADEPARARRWAESVYARFNERDLAALIALLHPDVDWPNAWEGGRLRGHAAVRDYWTRQWAEIVPHVEPLDAAAADDGRIVVDVRQTVRDLAGRVLDSRRVRHAYRLEHGTTGRVTRMDVLDTASDLESSAD